MVADSFVEELIAYYMAHPTISILVPIYKVEQYLQRCIDSVFAQDFGDWELILVDDGSPDRCGKICDANASLYPDKIKVVHKENGGLISARRAGVLAAQGEYYMFLDSDDWLMPGALQVLYSAITSQEEYDMVRGGAQRVDDEGHITPLETYSFEEGEITDTEDFLVKMYTGKVAPYLWGALYKASLFSAETFDESIEKKISLGEDLVTNLIVGLQIHRVRYIKELVYNYFINPASIMSTQLVSSNYGKRLEDYLHDRVFVHYSVLLEWQLAKYASYSFRNCFIPEVGFSTEYDRYRPYLSDDRYRNKIQDCLAPRYLYMAKYKFFFQLYTWIYRCTYLYLKQGGKKKKRLQ